MSKVDLITIQIEPKFGSKFQEETNINSILSMLSAWLNFANGFKTNDIKASLQINYTAKKGEIPKVQFTEEFDYKAKNTFESNWDNKK